MPRCLIAAGGTAGHVLPALAIADALRQHGVEVSFAGLPERAEGTLVREAGYELDTFRTAGLPRSVSVELLRATALTLRAPFSGLRILRERRPDVVLGGGGHVAGPMLLAARLLGVPAAATEADAHLGLANRLSAHLVRRMFLAYPVPGREGERYRVVGRPIPRRSLAAVGQAEARAAFGLPPEGPVVLVVGGSQGARALNEAALAAFGAAGPAVLHLCGTRDEQALAGRPRRDDYVLVAFTDEFGTALAACDLVVSRAGGTVWEIAAAGKPAILVPYPHATGDHQTRNAEHFAAGGGALLVPQAELDLPRQVGGLLADRARLASMAAAMHALARPDAADTIAAEVMRLAAARG